MRAPETGHHEEGDPAQGLPSPAPRQWAPEAVLRTRRRDHVEQLIPLEVDPTPTLAARVTRALSVPALAGAAFFVMTIVIAIVVVALRVQPQAAPEPADSALTPGLETTHGALQGESASKPADESAERGPDGSPSRSSPTTVVVHVAGEVQQPGIVELPMGARVGEAIEAAGGGTQRAALDAVNLARVVSDGEQILIPNVDDAGVAAAPGQSAESEPHLVNLNSADATALEALPGVGPALAGRIIDWREANGGFTSEEQLLEVSGIGPKVFEGLRERVTV